MVNKTRRIRIRATDRYVVFRLEDEVTINELTAASHGHSTAPPRTQLLALAMRTSRRVAAAHAVSSADTPPAGVSMVMPDDQQVA